MTDSNSVEDSIDLQQNSIMPFDSRSGAGSSQQNERQECLPFRTLSEIWSWRKETWPNLVVDFSPRVSLVVPGDRISCAEGVQARVHKDSAPRTIFCHDLKGGYLEDRFVNGSNRHDEYRFFHWAGIDTFIYFSHQLLTIPPLGWINAGHRHGVPVLGTFITEGDEGARIWQQILVDRVTVARLADALAVICRHYRFDGYLLNVENPIPKELVPLLVTFVSELRHSLHRLGQWFAQVIWYDSVTCEGALKWQNKLNGLNRCFFDACDGIFLNYTWKAEDLDQSIKVAGPRCHDVYVGVDVFGRNCFGGGGFNSSKALSVIRSKNLSAALFAASWTHECLRRDNFTHLEYLFWQNLWPYLFIHGPSKLPFSTSFCQGYGTAIYQYGEIKSRKPWYNLSKQNYQPSVSSSLSRSKVLGSNVHPPRRHGDPPPVDVLSSESAAEPKCAKIPRIDTDEPLSDSQGIVAHYSDDAFDGGGCLRIGGPGHYSLRRMLVCSFMCMGSVLISIATKTLVSPPQPSHELPSDTLYLTLLIKNRRGHSREILVSEATENADTFSGECATKVHRPLRFREVSELQSTLQYGNAINQLNVVGNNGWSVRHYSIHIDGSILEIGAEVESADQTVLLGWLAVNLQDS